VHNIHVGLYDISQRRFPSCLLTIIIMQRTTASSSSTPVVFDETCVRIYGQPFSQGKRDERFLETSP
jgi:hypothetical protein